jgi:hypothetical protein
MKRFAVVTWLKSFTNSVGNWWAIMSGGLSIPFAFFALFNIPGRLLFAGLAYISLLVLTVTQARRLTELQERAPSPDVTIRVARDIIDSSADPHWIRGEIKNEGDRGAEGCRVKLLRVEGENIVGRDRIENGVLEWKGGGCGPKRLDPDERLIFDIGTRNRVNDSPLVLLAFFEGNQVGCRLSAPGTYTLTFGLYGSGIPSKRETFIFELGAEVEDIEFRRILDS